MSDLSFWIGHICLGPLILLVGLFFKLRPPKNINALYGYRSPRSMKNQANWDEANRHSANALLMVCLLTMVAQAVFIFTLNKEISFLASAGFLVVSLVSTIFITEAHLKKFEAKQKSE